MQRHLLLETSCTYSLVSDVWFTQVSCAIWVLRRHWPHAMHNALVTPSHTTCANKQRTRFCDILHMNGLKPICNHSDIWNCQCEHNYSLPIYFAFLMHDTHFWCTVTLVCVCIDALGVDWKSFIPATEAWFQLDETWIHPVSPALANNPCDETNPWLMKQCALVRAVR